MFFAAASGHAEIAAALLAAGANPEAANAHGATSLMAAAAAGHLDAVAPAARATQGEKVRSAQSIAWQL